MHLKNKVILSILIVTMSVVGSKAVANGFYEVYEVEGEPLVWRQLGSDWIAVVQGMRLEEGTILQMPAAAMIAVRGVARSPKDTKESVPLGFKLKAEDPLITRLHSSSMRGIEIAGYYFQAEGAEKKKSAKPKKEKEDGDSDHENDVDQKSSIYTAWQRALSFFNPKSENRGDDVGTQLAARTGPGSSDKEKDEVNQLEITVPINGGTILLPELPNIIGAAWEAPPGKSAPEGYAVYLWREDKGKPHKVGVTDGTFMRLRVRREGRYLLRVETLDGKWRSKTHLFVVAML
jgi:hypothetical protein